MMNLQERLKKNKNSQVSPYNFNRLGSETSHQNPAIFILSISPAVGSSIPPMSSTPNAHSCGAAGQAARRQLRGDMDRGSTFSKLFI